MKLKLPVSALALAIILCGGPARAQDTGFSALTLDAYKAELQRWSERVAATNGDAQAMQQLRADLPSVLLVVTSDGRRFEVGTGWLNAALGDIVTAKADRAVIVHEIQERLRALQQQADEFRQPSTIEDVRGQLESILARREFRRVQGPSVFEVWRDKISLWIFRALNRIFRKIPSDTQLGQVFVWLVIAAGMAALAIWLKRMPGRESAESHREPIPFAPSARSWRNWLADARQAAQEARWRDAVHLAYWAGISHLEESGAWVPDHARTPREYLRLLPALSDKRPVLTALTKKFEIIWYGHRDAGADDFGEAVSRLEQLGCR